MKKFFGLFMIFPDYLALYFLISRLGSVVFGYNQQLIYFFRIFNISFYLLTIICTITGMIICRHKNPEDVLLFNMKIKIFHMPGYILLYVIALFYAIMIIGIYYAFIICIVCCTTMIMSGIIGCIGIKRFSKNNEVFIDKKIVHYICQFIVGLDIVSSAILYNKYIKKTKRNTSNAGYTIKSNSLIKILSYYPYVSLLMFFITLLLIGRLSDSLSIYPYIYPLCLLGFNVIMIEMVIIFSFKMMKSGVTSNEMIDIALRIKSRHRIVFLLYIICGIWTFVLIIPWLWLLLCGWFMIIQSGIIGCAGFITGYSNDKLSFVQMAKYIIVQFIPFADVICDKRFLAKNRI